MGLYPIFLKRDPDNSKASRFFILIGMSKVFFVSFSRLFCLIPFFSATTEVVQAMNYRQNISLILNYAMKYIKALVLVPVRDLDITQGGKMILTSME